MIFAALILFKKGPISRARGKQHSKHTENTGLKLKASKNKIMMASFSYNKTPKLQSWF